MEEVLHPALLVDDGQSCDGILKEVKHAGFEIHLRPVITRGQLKQRDRTLGKWHLVDSPAACHYAARRHRGGAVMVASARASASTAPGREK